MLTPQILTLILANPFNVMSSNDFTSKLVKIWFQFTVKKMAQHSAPKLNLTRMKILSQSPVRGKDQSHDRAQLRRRRQRTDRSHEYRIHQWPKILPKMEHTNLIKF